MRCRTLFLIGTLPILSNCHAASSVKQLISKIKSMEAGEGIKRILTQLEIPQDTIKSMNVSFIPPESERGIRVERAETFLEDMDGDGKKDAVSQIIFSNDPDYGKSNLEYLIMVHRQPDQPKSLAYFRRFDMMKCGYVKASGVKFNFVKNTAGKGAKILFRVTDVTGCSIDGQEFTQSVDTLSLDSGKWTYTKDNSPKTTSRSGDPEGP